MKREKMMDTIENMLKNIEPIIMNCRKMAKIPSWEIDDYMQEGRIIALELYNKLTLCNDTSQVNFYIYFKVRYSCFLIDTYRKTNAFKRKFDQPIYLDVSEAFNIYDHKQNVADNVIYDLLFQEILAILTPAEVETLNALKRGEKVDRNKKFRIKKKIINYINEIL